MNKRVWRLNDHDGPGGLIVDDPRVLLDVEIEVMDIGDGPLYLWCEMMEEEKIANLPEWDGF